MLVSQYNNMIRKCAMMSRTSPEFLDKYFKTKTLQRLKGKGMFCGMDYVGLDMLIPREYYSRFDHSRNVAFSAWTLSEDVAVTLAGAFHDVGSLSFAHVNSFKKGQELTQADDEINVRNVLMQDEELLAYLKQDGVSLNSVIDYSKYPLLDKEIPALCLDRVDGILTTCLFWAKTHGIKKITQLYSMLAYFENLNGMCFDLSSDRLMNFNGEIVLEEQCTSTDYEDFFKAISIYSKLLLSKESRYIMKVFGMVLRFYEEVGVINEQELFQLSEQEIINKILASKYSSVWQDFTRITKVDYADNLPDKNLIIFSQPKIRQANPLCMGQMEVCEISTISGEFYRQLVDLEAAIELTSKPLASNLDARTEKVLSRYI